MKGEDDKTYYQHIHQALEHKPNITMDDGADLVATIHKERRDLIPNMHWRHGRDDYRRHKAYAAWPAPALSPTR